MVKPLDLSERAMFGYRIVTSVRAIFCETSGLMASRNLNQFPPHIITCVQIVPKSSKRHTCLVQNPFVFLHSITAWLVTESVDLTTSQPITATLKFVSIYHSAWWSGDKVRPKKALGIHAIRLDCSDYGGRLREGNQGLISAILLP